WVTTDKDKWRHDKIQTVHKKNVPADLGHEIEGAVTYKPIKGLMVQSGYGAFVPGAAAQALGATEPQHFLWLWMVFDIDYALGK
ncbi:MAG: hypothetical protein AAF721_07580, partial [Myxococcota bacterium]